MAKQPERKKLPIVHSLSGKNKINNAGQTKVAKSEDHKKLPTTTTVKTTQSTSVVSDVNLLAYMRALPIDFTGYNLRPNRRVYPYFDGKNIGNYIQRANKIILNTSAYYQTMITGPLSGRHYSNGGIGYVTCAIDTSREEVFLKDGKARVLFTEYDETGNTIIYTTHVEARKNIEADCHLPTFIPSDVDNPATYKAPEVGAAIIEQIPVYVADQRVDANSVVGVKTGASANMVSYEHYSGISRVVTPADLYSIYGDPSANGEILPPVAALPDVNPVIDLRRIKLAADASPVDNIYSGNTITFVNGSQPGTIANIVSYNGATRIAEIENFGSEWFGLLPKSNVIYSIGDSRVPYSTAGGYQAHFTTNKGFLAGVLHIPDPNNASSEYRFRVGEKIFSITDSPTNDVNDSTTVAEYKFTAAGLGVSTRQLVTSTVNVVVTPPAPNPPPPAPEPPAPNPPTPPRPNQPEREREKKKDPIAQSFFISADEYPQGLFVPFIDIFFGNKGTLPVEMQIRPLVNGVPSSNEIIPNAISIVQSEDIKVSAAPNAEDSNTYTRFAFTSPVYLAPNTDYAFVVLTNDFDYDIYVSELGEKIIGTDRVVSEQPFLGSMFKSQNATTYTPIQSEDIMFVIHKCDFTSAGSIIFNEEKDFTFSAPYKDKFYDSNTVFDAFEVHSDTVEVAGTTATFYYKSINASDNSEDAEYTVFKPETRTLLPERKIVYGKDIDTRSFNMKVDLETTSADVSPVVFVKRQNLGTLTTIINNMGISGYRVSITEPGANQTTQNTSITFAANTGSGANATAVIKIEPIKTGKIAGLKFDSYGQNYYDDVTCTVTSSDANVTPAKIIVDSETGKAGGPALSRYLSKTVTLAPEFDAGDLRVYLTAVKPPEANIQVYYKVRNRYDADPIAEKKWVRMEQKVGTINYSTSLNPIELEFRPSMSSNNIVYSTNTATFDTFTQFKIKIVMASSDTVLTKIPYIYDMRAIALPADTR